ncbi:MAG TPA: carotenoid 1,2-hydratase [Burkholderiaceae bacterium]|nr:carotenoid 1,2-hydratase [Burkholderiaceae bacterium]
MRAGVPLRFPADHGSHPEFRIEWWYLTGWLERDAGFQVTFFRARTTHSDANPSRFAPHQLILAHAALALPSRGRLLHAQRAARTALGLAGAAEGDTRIWIDPWQLVRNAGNDRYRALITAPEFALDLQLQPDRPPLLQGDAGFSRKGPRPEQASYYYSRPHLAVMGRMRTGNGERSVTGRGWFDHEWSSEILDERASGWDWVGLNLDDGSALMAFRIRLRDAEPQAAPLWSTARWQRPDGSTFDAAPVFAPLRHWRSPRSGALYPVAMRLQVADRVLELAPLFDDQELDARSSTGTIYWEGAVVVHEAGREIGRGYLELTGYAAPLRL